MSKKMNLQRIGRNVRYIPFYFLSLLITLSSAPLVKADDKIFYQLNDIVMYSEGTPAAPCSTSSSGSGAVVPPSSGSPDGYDSAQVKTFSLQPINSTWNIPDATVEQWFLQQESVNNTAVYEGIVKGVIPRYGITAANIGEITATVKAAGVSPALFYAYTVTEGGGLAGFINHFRRSLELPGAIESAKRDAEYMVKIANSTEYGLAWKDEGTSAGNGDFVPKSVQDAGNADFKNMPTGTIGRVLIPSTAAVVWEVYYPDGLKGSVNGVQNYGAPMQAIMKTIKRIGGDPLDGGAVVSPTGPGCTTPTTVAGEGITKAINWALMIAENDGYGYNQDTRATGWTKWKADAQCTVGCGDFDCSSFVSAALTEAGYYEINPNFATSGQEKSLSDAGFQKLTISSFSTSAELLPGDILVTPGAHTEIYIGNDQMVGAHNDENGNITGGKAGDQTGKEISVGPYKNHPWSSAWRATK